VTHEHHVAGARQRSFACGHGIVLACQLSGTLTDERALSLATLA